MTGSWRPVDPRDLTGLLVGWLASVPGRVRVAVEGPPASRPAELAESMSAALPSSGRAAGHVRAEFFWRDASLRLEHGREDLDSYRQWLDAETLTREVLRPVAADGRYLPSLRDPATNRATREPARVLPPEGVLIVSGSLLLERGLPFDRSVHLSLSAAALARRTPAADAWTLPAYARTPAADVVVKLDDPRHPAVRGLPAN